MKEFLETGKISGTHGVRGMVRIQPWCDSNEFLCSFDTLYLASGRALEVEKMAPHGTVVIAKLRGVDTIEAAEELRNKVISIKRSDVCLEEGRYFVDDIIGCKVYNIENNELLGEVCDVSATGANDVWHIKTENGIYLIPKIDEIVKSVDVESAKIEISVMKGLFSDED
ncbi:MAG: 16S rRNA processing protein RimM [Clostridia bacterium]|nr:16S rRNA processing protein RimM [Clostridia bacterium]